MLLFIKSGDGRKIHRACRVNLSKAFQVCKEEGLIVDHRSTDTSSELILAQLRLFAGSEEVFGVSDIVAEVFEQRSVEAVGAGFSDDVYGDSCGSANLGGIQVCIDNDLLNRLNGRTHQGEPLVSLVVIEAVDHLVIQ